MLLVKRYGKHKLKIPIENAMDPIKIILNLPDHDSPLGGILKDLRDKLSDVRILPITTCDELKDALSLNPESRNMVLLSVKDEDDIKKLKKMGSFLQEEYLILLIPEGEPGLKSMARKLRPRYIATSPEALNQLPVLIEAVVRKMEREIAGAPNPKKDLAE